MVPGDVDIELLLSSIHDIRFLRAVLRELAALSNVSVDDVVLAASEVATNALLYTTGPARVRAWNYSPHGPTRVEVRDPLPIALQPVCAPDPTSSSGRGLWIVDHLVSRWGVDVHDGLGKTVWFEIDRLDW